MSIATLDPPTVSEASATGVLPDYDALFAPAHDSSLCYLCGGVVALRCDRCGKAACKHCYRTDYGPCLIERDWCIPCANEKAQERHEAYAAYRAHYGGEPEPLRRWSSPRFA